MCKYKTFNEFMKKDRQAALEWVAEKCLGWYIQEVVTFGNVGVPVWKGPSNDYYEALCTVEDTPAFESDLAWTGPLLDALEKVDVGIILQPVKEDATGQIFYFVEKIVNNGDGDVLDSFLFDGEHRVFIHRNLAICEALWALRGESLE